MQRRILKNIYRSLFESHLHFGSIVWGFAKQSYIKKVGNRNSFIHSPFIMKSDRRSNARIFSQMTSNVLTQASLRLYEIRQHPTCLCTTSNFLMVIRVTMVDLVLVVMVIMVVIVIWVVMVVMEVMVVMLVMVVMMVMLVKEETMSNIS